MIIVGKLLQQWESRSLLQHIVATPGHNRNTLATMGTKITGWNWFNIVSSG
jgi:hypothetical protein